MTTIEKNTCRLCFSTSDNNVEIFSEKNSDGLTSIGRMIVDCLLSELEPNTGYPEIVCQLCQLQLNVFFEFKKKVFLNHKKFATILNNTKDASPEMEPGPAVSKRRVIKIDVENINQQNTRPMPKLEKYPCGTVDFSRNEMIICDTMIQERIESPIQKNPLKRSSDDADDDEEEIKFIKLETSLSDDDVIDLFNDQSDENNDETEHYLEEQYLDSCSDFDENTEVEYVYDEDDENYNSLKEELFMKSGSTEPDQDIKKVRKPKTPRLKKYITERVLDADTMKEYDAVKCLNCSEYFETMEKFTAHHKACDKVACKVCGKMLTSSGMDLHLRQHNTEKPFSCSICAKGFTTAQQCSDHEFRHKNQRPFDCHICNKTFKMKCDLRTHIMCHQDIRKHSCPICEKRFRMRSHVTAHLETHNANNVFECRECGLMLKTSSSLKGHISQMHSTSYKHNCAVCERGFAKLDRFKRHMKIHDKKRLPINSESSNVTQ